MNVADIMTRDVLAVPETVSIHEAAALMVDRGVSGLPVVNDDNVPIGIITEGDLILRQRAPSLKRRSWWSLLFSDAEAMARDYQRSAGMTVGEVMSRAVVSVGPEWPIESVASMLDRLHYRRMPVVDRHGRLVGIVSRADLIKALAVAPVPSGSGPRADEDLATDMRGRLAKESWVSQHAITVEAVKGVLWIYGTVESETERAAIETMARTVEGCRTVRNNLTIRMVLLPTL